MHPYVTDSNERINIPLYIAVISIASAWLFITGLNFLVDGAEPQSISLVWWVQAPSVIGFYGLYYASFDKILWRNEIIRKICQLNTPNLNGIWEGYLTSSYTNHNTEYNVRIVISQTWTKISAILETDNSRSWSQMALIKATNSDDTIFSYQYQNEPSPDALNSMNMHRGTAELYLGNDFETLDGGYYSGRGRGNIGTIHLKKTAEDAILKNSSKSFNGNAQKIS